MVGNAVKALPHCVALFPCSFRAWSILCIFPYFRCCILLTRFHLDKTQRYLYCKYEVEQRNDLVKLQCTADTLFIPRFSFSLWLILNHILKQHCGQQTFIYLIKCMPPSNNILKYKLYMHKCLMLCANEMQIKYNFK